MNLLAQHPDPRIPLSVLLLALAHSARLQAQRQMLRPPVMGDGPDTIGETERAQEEPERWDGLS
jgi:hypothetical protein